MRAVVHVIPCRSVLEDTERRGSGIATMALRVAERFDAPADLVLIAVPAGKGAAIAERLITADRGPAPRRPPSRYISEHAMTDAEFRELNG